jgi:hypothetical protein
VVAERERSAFVEKMNQRGDLDGALILRIPTPEAVDAAHPAPHAW